MKRTAAALALLALLALLAPAPGAAEAPASGGRLRIAAAANLKPAVEALRKAFEAAHPGVEVQVSVGASGTLFAQLENGAPYDVFLSADRAYPAKLVAAGLGSDERVYAFGRLVAWLPPGSSVPLERKGLAALADPAVKRIAIANPAAAPFGRATVAAFEAAGVREAVKGKLVMGASVAQAAQFATTGAADVAFLPYALTFAPELSGGRVVFVPEALYPRIEQSAVILDAARDPALARAFLDLVTGEQGRAILARLGYGLP